MVANNFCGFRRGVALAVCSSFLALFLSPDLAIAKQNSPTSPDRALEILGQENFLSSRQVISALNNVLREKGIQLLEIPREGYVPYSERTLREHADGKWLLFWNPGFSLRELHSIFGTEPRLQPCLFGSRWWLSTSESYWATQRSIPGYLLIHKEGVFQRLTWFEQEKVIGNLGKSYSRAPTSVVANATLLYYLIRGQRLFLLNYHWGPEMDTLGHAVGMGDFFKTGLGVYSWPPDRKTDFLGVSLICKRDL